MASDLLVTGTAARAPGVVRGWSVAIAVGLAVGALTAYAQGWLGDATSSLANSAGPWATAAFLVARYQRRLIPAMGAAVITLACSELGYAIATRVRGGSNASSTVLLWLTAAVLAGPPLGIAAAWSTRPGMRGGMGFAVLGGVLLGEGVYGWTTVADTTDWRYWMVETILGAAVILAAALRTQGAVPAIVVVGTGAATAAVLLLASRLL